MPGKLRIAKANHELAAFLRLPRMHSDVLPWGTDRFSQLAKEMEINPAVPPANHEKEDDK